MHAWIGALALSNENNANMKSCTLSFPYNARRVYTAVKGAFRRDEQFKHVKCDDELFVITARHGASLLALGENIKVQVVATGTSTSRVVVESGNQLPINLLNLGQNKQNVSDLSDYIQNQVYRLVSDDEIRLAPPNIILRK